MLILHKYKVGIIGSGLQANRRAESIQSNQYCVVNTIAGIDKDTLSKLAKKCYAKEENDWQNIILNNEIDIVLICTPPHLHFEIASLALENNKHVLCEKPLTMSSKDAIKLHNISLKTNSKIMCGFNHRHHPAVIEAYKVVKQGKIGTPITGRAVYGICGREGCENEWRSDPKCVSGGQLMEQGIHIADLFRWFMGDFESVSADVSTQVFPIFPLEDTAVMLLHGSNGKTATIHSSITQWRNKFRFELYGTQGYVEITGLGGSYDLEQLVIGKREPESPFSEKIVDYRGSDKSWVNEWNYFIDVIENNEEFEMGNTLDAAIANYFVERAYEASSSKTRLGLNKDALVNKI